MNNLISETADFYELRGGTTQIWMCGNFGGDSILKCLTKERKKLIISIRLIPLKQGVVLTLHRLDFNKASELQTIPRTRINKIQKQCTYSILQKTRCS